MCNSGANPRCPLSAPAGAAEEEFARAFHDNFRLLWCIAAGIVGNADTAEDVVQEAALIGLGKYQGFRDGVGEVKPGDARLASPRESASNARDRPTGTAFAAWMGKIVRYVALNQYRKDRIHRTVALPEDHQDTRPRPDLAPRSLKLTRGGQLPQDQQAFDDQVIDALREVSDVARACLLLRTLEAADYEQIGRLLDIPPGTAMSHVFRARRILRRRLAQREPRNTGGKNSIA